MKIIQINATCGKGSTGKICVDISKLLTKNNVENYILYSVNETKYPLGIKFAGNLYLKYNAIIAKMLGNWGFVSFKSTKKIIAELDRIHPDIIHLHNIHSHDCNLEMLFKYIKENGKKVIWTFHDCWAFTGYCMYFSMIKCDKWKTMCSHCPLKKESTWLFDRSSKIMERKKKLFSGLDMTIVTPSQWLADLVKQSFLKDYPVKVINNGIDLTVFKPTEIDFRKKYGIENRFIVLGVAFGWEKRKGLDVFIELSKRLDNSYRIVLVGTDEKIDAQLPAGIISIHKTHTQTELAGIYTAADVFVQPTREENYPTVNMEALACGTPVVTFRTGGSPEIHDETCGTVVEYDDVDAMEKAIYHVCVDKPYTKESCLQRAKHFDNSKRFKEYVSLYNTVIGG